jgi:transcriptional regulator with XRE-family HTH domain
VAEFHLPGVLRRIRRAADLSQREFAAALGVSQSAVAQGESGRRDFPVGILVRAAGLAGLRLALVDGNGNEVSPMAHDAVRDMGYRRFPAHLDTRYSDEGWWHGPERYSRPQPWYTFDRDRDARDAARAATGTPVDHQIPQAGDSPEERRRKRQLAARRRWAAEIQRRREAGALLPAPLDLVCSCPPQCEQLDEGLRPVHAPACTCGCDID